MTKFAATDAGGVKNFQNRPVAETNGQVYVGDGNDALNVRASKNGLGKTIFGARHLQFGGGIGRHDLQPGEVAEKTRNGGQPLALGASGQRPAIGSGSQVQLQLVCGDGFTRHFLRALDAVSRTVTGKIAQLFRLTGKREFAVIPGQQIVQVVLEQFLEADGRFQFLAFVF